MNGASGLAQTKTEVDADRSKKAKLEFRETRHFVKSRLKNLHTLSNVEPLTARAEIAKLLQKIEITAGTPS